MYKSHRPKAIQTSLLSAFVRISGIFLCLLIYKEINFKNEPQKEARAIINR